MRAKVQSEKMQVKVVFLSIVFLLPTSFQGCDSNHEGCLSLYTKILFELPDYSPSPIELFSINNNCKDLLRLKLAHIYEINLSEIDVYVTFYHMPNYLEPQPETLVPQYLEILLWVPKDAPKETLFDEFSSLITWSLQEMEKKTYSIEGVRKQILDPEEYDFFMKEVYPKVDLSSEEFNVGYTKWKKFLNKKYGPPPPQP